MPKCEQCGNDYDKAFEVRIRNEVHVFDSFECAATKLAPTCARCGARILGHGMEANGSIYCCAHCANMVGVQGMRDRV